jgi:hypothetical protein
LTTSSPALFCMAQANGWYLVILVVIYCHIVRYSDNSCSNIIFWFDSKRMSSTVCSASARAFNTEMLAGNVSCVCEKWQIILYLWISYISYT